MVGWSAAAHLGLLGLVLITPGGEAMRGPAVIDVALIGLPQPAAPAAPAAPRPAKPAAAPKPQPAAEPVPPPPPPPPKPDAIVLPEKPTQAPKPKPRPREEREVFREPEPEKTPEKSLEEVMAEMRGEQNREDLLAEMREQEAAVAGVAGEPSEAAPSEAPAGGGGGGSALSAEEAGWQRRVKVHMKGRWILPAGFRTQVLQTIVSVRLDGGGNILGDPQIAQRSGNPWYDESVMRGLGKASPLPPPPEAGTYQLVFRPEDSF